MVINGYVWLCMVIYGYIWLFTVINGYVWLCMVIYGYVWLYMWHSRRKSTFRCKNTKMKYLYHVVALTLLYLLVLVALQSVLLFPSYKGKGVDH